jgi:hypothetical protein
VGKDYQKAVDIPYLRGGVVADHRGGLSRELRQLLCHLNYPHQISSLSRTMLTRLSVKDIDRAGAGIEVNLIIGRIMDDRVSLAGVEAEIPPDRIERMVDYPAGNEDSPVLDLRPSIFQEAAGFRICHADTGFSQQLIRFSQDAVDRFRGNQA